MSNKQTSHSKNTSQDIAKSQPMTQNSQAKVNNSTVIPPTLTKNPPSSQVQAPSKTPAKTTAPQNNAGPQQPTMQKAAPTMNPSLQKNDGRKFETSTSPSGGKLTTDPKLVKGINSNILDKTDKKYSNAPKDNNRYTNDDSDDFGRADNQSKKKTAKIDTRKNISIGNDSDEYSDDDFGQGFQKGKREDPAVQQTMIKIAQYMSDNIIEVENAYFDIDMNVKRFSGNILGVDEVKFIKYFTNKRTFNLKVGDVKKVADKFRLKLNGRRGSVMRVARVQNIDTLVNWEEFSEAIESLNVLSMTKIETSKKSRSQYKDGLTALDKILEKVQELVMLQGGGIFEVFRFIDADDSNSIEFSEFQDVVKKLGVNVTRDEVKTIFRKYDENQNNNLSFGEFSRMVEHVEEHVCLSDSSHWAFSIFENFRRKHMRSKKSITEIFKAQYQKGDKECFISWENFYDVFEADQYISPEIKSKLKTLLDVKANNGRVDLVAFHCLVGINMKPAKAKGKSKNKAYDEEDTSNNWQGERQLVRELMQRLSKARIDHMGLRRDLKLAANKRDTVDRETFIELICGSVEGYQDFQAEKVLEKTVSKIAQKFQAKGKDQVDYQQFIAVFAQYQELFKATGLMFRQFDTLMEKEGLKSKDGKIQKGSLEKLLKNYSKNVSKGKLSSDETAAVFTKMLLRLEDWELQLVCEEFDPTGRGANIDIDLLSMQFDEWAIEKQDKEFKERTGGKYEDDYNKKYPESDSDQDDEKKAAQDSKAFEEVMDRIAKDYHKSKVTDFNRLFQRYEEKKGKFNPRVDGTQFLTAVREAPLSKGGEEVFLSRAEARVLEQKYSRGKWMQYEEFQDDIRSRVQLLDDTKDLNSGQNFTKPAQKQLFERLRQWIRASPEETAVQLTIAFKRRDRGGKGFVKNTDIATVLTENGFRFSNDTEHATLLTMIGKQGADSSYKDIISILKGQDYCGKIMAYSSEELKKGSFKPVAQFVAAKFVSPSEPVNPKEPFLGQIGSLLCQSGLNYEKEFAKALDDDPQAKAKPMIRHDALLTVFRKLNIELNTSIKQKLQEYVQSRQNADDKKFPLLKFLSDIGLPAQTLGSEALRAQEALKLLSREELERCHEMIVELRKAIQAMKAQTRSSYREPVDLFLNQRRDQDATELDPEEFLRIVEDKVDSKLATRMRQMQRELTAYLAETKRDQINYAKLGRALALKSGDVPLVQAGTTALTEAQAQVRRKLGGAGDTIDSPDTVVKNFVAFCVKFNYTYEKLFEQPPAWDLPIVDFVGKLEDIDFKTDHQEALIKALDKDRTGVRISSSHLDSLLGKGFAKEKLSQGVATTRVKDLEASTRKVLAILLRQLDVQKISTEQLFKALDADGDAKVDKQEFVDRMAVSVGFEAGKLSKQELGKLFDAFDVGKSGELTINALGAYLQGAKQDKADRIKNMDAETKRLLEFDIEEMFQYFDVNGDGSVDAGEISTTLRLLGQNKDVKECQAMIDKAGGDASGIGKKQFKGIMLPIMQEQLLNQEDNVEDLRKKFVEADVDGSGALSVEELYAALKKAGAQVSCEDIVQLVTEIDVDRDGELDIDEFVALMTHGGQMDFKNPKSRVIHDKIQVSRQHSALRFLQAFQVMPSNFVSSFTTKRWEEERQNLPSSVFSLQVDPKTMCWKDVREPDAVKQKSTDQFDSKFAPKLRPMEPGLCARITIGEATGVPGPESLAQSGAGGKAGGKESEIVKRALRLSLEVKTGLSKSLVGNAIQIPVDYNPANQDLWSFDTSEAAKLMRAVLFRTSSWEGYDKTEAEGRILFELVAYVKAGEGDSITEMSCGWAMLPLDALKATTNFDQKLPINGGTPIENIEIAQSDVRAQRSGLKFVQAAFQGVKSTLSVSITVAKKLEKPVTTHLHVMPSTCLVHASLLTFLSGFMNYKAMRILSEPQGKFQKPQGDAILCSIATVLDNPDIMQELAPAWEKYASVEINKQPFDVDLIIDKSCDFLQRLYPVIHAQEFMNIKAIGSTKSGDGYKGIHSGDKRRKLVKNALGYNQGGKKTDASNPYEETSFEPFNINELEFDVWDTTKNKGNLFLERHKSSAKPRSNYRDASPAGPPQGRKVTFGY